MRYFYLREYDINYKYITYTLVTERNYIFVLCYNYEAHHLIKSNQIFHYTEKCHKVLK